MNATLKLLCSTIVISHLVVSSCYGMPIQTNHMALQTMQMTSSEFEALSIDEQKTRAAAWSLDTTDYSHYVWLMQHSPSGWYYADKHLDPSWVLGFNAKDDSERKKFAVIAIKNERIRIEHELAFQRVFSEVQQTLYPNELPIRDRSLSGSYTPIPSEKKQ